ncbi:conserved hypothetical protein [Neorickettsia risticii str. Illinois]|uniref:Uncharacterized protein n=1 Tax=Neorickettsia risticii (strain Illinois) TaxID=434131 RepID=C6V593_NEORI|nr:conserved hypothetical protein [Neorickettsia risticii str. Illinois]
MKSYSSGPETYKKNLSENHLLIVVQTQKNPKLYLTKIGYVQDSQKEKAMQKNSLP